VYLLPKWIGGKNKSIYLYQNYVVFISFSSRWIQALFFSCGWINLDKVKKIPIRAKVVFKVKNNRGGKSGIHA
jgi:hypothetical protein